MAEVLARRLLAQSGNTLRVSSAGLRAPEGQPASENAVLIAREHGEDLSRHRTRPLNLELVRESDLILTMTQDHRDAILRTYPSARGKVYSLPEFSGLVERGDLVDPYGGDPARYRETWASIEEHLRAALPRLVDDSSGREDHEHPEVG
jgi:protein-tyrosine-phosphatase